MLLKIKKEFIKYRKYFPFFAFIFLLIAFVYKDLFLTFYQQDEWVGYGRLLSFGSNAIFEDFSLWQILSGQGRVLGRLSYIILYPIFPFQIFPFAILSILLHTANTILLFLITLKITKKVLISMIASIFFAVAWVSSQSLVWAASASIQVLPSAFLIFLSVLFYLKYLDSNKKKFFNISAVSLIVSLYFKESGLFLFAFLPVLYLVYAKKPSISNFFKNQWWLFLFLSLFFVFNVLGLAVADQKEQGFTVTGGANPISKVLFHVFFYPITSISQMFLPDTFIYNLTKPIVEIQYSSILPIANGPMYVSIVADLISLLFSLYILFACILIFTIRGNEKKTFTTVILFIFFSFLPFIMLNRPNTYLESRYYYLGTAGGGMLLGLIFQQIKNFINLKLPLKRLFSFSLILLTSLFFLMNINIIKADINYKVEQSRQRKNVLSQIKKIKPTVSQKPIFYVTGNHDFLGARGLNLPFQQGIGYTLMVLYYDSKSTPKEFLRDRYLWKMDEEGYKEGSNGGSFGYFWDKEKLKKEFAKNSSLNTNQIVGFYYDAEKEKVIDITKETKEFLEKENKLDIK